jgi:2,4-dienoyl-CoA reductase-like NADH-dependent reductase (Old Yellow Enzyme family)
MPPISLAAILEPHALGLLRLRNRIHMGAMTRNRCKGNIPTDLQVEYYRQRARGGAGLIISEGTLISQQGLVLEASFLYELPILSILFQYSMAQCSWYLVSRAHWCVA